MKKCIAFLMTCLLMFFSPVLTLASTKELDFYLEPYRQEEQRRIDEITNSENSAEWLNVERDNMPLSNGMMTIGHQKSDTFLHISCLLSGLSSILNLCFSIYRF